MKMRLKYIETVDFRKSEATNFFEQSKKQKWSLKSGEVVCFVSGRGNQIVFVHPAEVNDFVGSAKARGMIIRSERLRLTSGSWNPLMLANYAKEMGIELEGIKRFEEHYKALTE